MGDEFADRRRAMVSEQLARRGIIDQRVLDAFARIERHRYVAEKLRSLAYEDRPLAIGSQQTVSQPYIVAYMSPNLIYRGQNACWKSARAQVTKPHCSQNWPSRSIA